MKKVAIIGYFFGGKIVNEGQGVKTKILADEIESILGSGNVWRIDTYEWKKNPYKLLKNAVLAILKCDSVIFMTDEGGIKVFPWLLRCINIMGKCNIYYVVVGGWLPHFLENHKFISYCLKGLQGIYVETNAMKRRLESKGFQNIYLMPNCKSIQPLKEEELIFQKNTPLRLCIFSRIMKEKGIEDAIEGVCEANKYFGKTVYTLDIYGQIDSEQKEWFKKLSENLPQEIKYCGVVPYNKSVDVVKNYYTLLFPTHFFTEGIPGTIIDAYASGVPVVVSEWENYRDIVVPDITGISYPFMKKESFKSILKDVLIDVDKINAMKINCLQKAREYLPQNVIGILVDTIIAEDKNAD